MMLCPCIADALMSTLVSKTYAFTAYIYSLSTDNRTSSIQISRAYTPYIHIQSLTNTLL